MAGTEPETGPKRTLSTRSMPMLVIAASVLNLLLVPCFLAWRRPAVVAVVGFVCAVFGLVSYVRARRVGEDRAMAMAFVALLLGVASFGLGVFILVVAWS